MIIVFASLNEYLIMLQSSQGSWSGGKDTSWETGWKELQVPH